MKQRLRRLFVTTILALALAMALAPSAHAIGAYYAGEMYCDTNIVVSGQNTRHFRVQIPAAGSTYQERQWIRWTPELLGWHPSRGWYRVALGRHEYSESQGQAYGTTGPFGTTWWQYKDAAGRWVFNYEGVQRFPVTINSPGNNYFKIRNHLYWYPTSRDPGGSRWIDSPVENYFGIVSGGQTCGPY